MCVITKSDMQREAQAAAQQKQPSIQPKAAKEQQAKVQAATQQVIQSNANVDPRAKMNPPLYTHV